MLQGSPLRPLYFAVSVLALFCSANTRSLAAGKIINIYPVPLLSAVAKDQEQKVTAALVDAFDRIPGYSARLVDNVVPKTTYGAYVIEGPGLTAQTSSLAQAYPKPTSTASSEFNTITVSGKIKNIYALNAKTGDIPESTPAYYDVTSQLLPIDDSHFQLLVYVKSLMPNGTVGFVRSGQLVANASLDEIVSQLKKIDVSALLSTTPLRASRSRVLLMPLLGQSPKTDPYIGQRISQKLENAGILPVIMSEAFSSSPADAFKQCLVTGSNGIMTYNTDMSGPQSDIIGFTRKDATVDLQYYSCIGEPVWSGAGNGKKQFWHSPSQTLAFTYLLWHNLAPKFDPFHHVSDALTLFTTLGGSSPQYSIDAANSDPSFQYVAVNRAVDDVVSAFCEQYVGFKPTEKSAGCPQAVAVVPTPSPLWTPLPDKVTKPPSSVALKSWLANFDPVIRDLTPSTTIHGPQAAYALHGLPKTSDGAWYDVASKRVLQIAHVNHDKIIQLFTVDASQSITEYGSSVDLSEVMLNNGVHLGMPMKRALSEFPDAPSLRQAGGSRYLSSSYPAPPQSGFCHAAATVVFDSKSANVVSAIAMRYFHC